jgi:hypothetical protein
MSHNSHTSQQSEQTTTNCDRLEHAPGFSVIRILYVLRYFVHLGTDHAKHPRNKCLIGWYLFLS